MSTEMERTQPQPQFPTYKALFSTKSPKRFQIKAAATRLGYVLGKVLESTMLEVWAEKLERFNQSQLTAAFDRAENEVAAFPAISHIVGYIERAQFDEQYLTILKHVRWHTVDWLDRPAYRDPEKYDWSGTDRVVIEGTVHPAEPAPVIPARMQRALELFGSGARRDGLVRLMRDHPNLWHEEQERETGQHSRQAALLEKDLLACWLRSGV